MSLEGRLDELLEFFWRRPVLDQLLILSLSLGQTGLQLGDVRFQLGIPVSSCRQRFFHPKIIMMAARRALGENQDASHIASAF